MSFKRKMRKVGIQKLDKIVETPNYIKEPVIVEKPRRTGLSWLKYAVPAALVITAIVATPIIFAVTMQGKSSKSLDYAGENEIANNTGTDSAPDNYDSEQSPSSEGNGGGSPTSSLSLMLNGVEYKSVNKNDLVNLQTTMLKIDFSKPIEQLIGEKIADATIENSTILFDGGYSIYHAKNSQSNQIVIAYNGQSYYWFVVNSLSKDLSFEYLLGFSGITNDFRLQVYDSDVNLLHTFKNESAVTIIDSLKAVPSTRDDYESKYASADKDVIGFPSGKNYIFVFTDGLDCLAGEYYSQINYLDVFSSDFNLADTEAYSTINEVIPLS